MNTHNISFYGEIYVCLWRTDENYQSVIINSHLICSAAVTLWLCYRQNLPNQNVYIICDI